MRKNAIKSLRVETLPSIAQFFARGVKMKKTSLFNKIASATAVVILGMANPVMATSGAKTPQISPGLVVEHSELLPTPQSMLIAARHCAIKRVYHKGYYSRRFGIVGRRQYHPGYYTTKRVCY